MVVVILSVDAVARSDDFGQAARILNISTSILAFLSRNEVVTIALATAVSELLTHTISTVVEPFDLIVGAWTMLVRKEAEVWSELDFLYRSRCCERSLAPIKTILLGVEIIFVSTATTVVELSTLLFVRIVVPALSIVVALSQ